MPGNNFIFEKLVLRAIQLILPGQQVPWVVLADFRADMKSYLENEVPPDRKPAPEVSSGDYLKPLLRPPFPVHIQLMKAMPFFVEYRKPWAKKPSVWVLHAGEVAEYFQHSDTYLFNSRDNYVPWISRLVAARLPEFFRVAEETTK